MPGVADTVHSDVIRERPAWWLSVYASASGGPNDVGLDCSPEEVRSGDYAALAKGEGLDGRRQWFEAARQQMDKQLEAFDAQARKNGQGMGIQVSPSVHKPSGYTFGASPKSAAGQPIAGQSFGQNAGFGATAGSGNAFGTQFGQARSTSFGSSQTADPSTTPSNPTAAQSSSGGRKLFGVSQDRGTQPQSSPTTGASTAGGIKFGMGAGSAAQSQASSLGGQRLFGVSKGAASQAQTSTSGGPTVFGVKRGNQGPAQNLQSAGGDTSGGGRKLFGVSTKRASQSQGPTFGAGGSAMGGTPQFGPPPGSSFGASTRQPQLPRLPGNLFGAAPAPSDAFKPGGSATSMAGLDGGQQMEIASGAVGSGDTPGMLAAGGDGKADANPWLAKEFSFGQIPEEPPPPEYVK